MGFCGRQQRRDQKLREKEKEKEKRKATFGLLTINMIG